MRAIGPALDIDAADAQFERVVRHNRATIPGHRAWAIESVQCTVPLGLIGLLRTERGAEFGLMLFPEARGRRIGSDAIALLLQYAFETARLPWLDAASNQDLDRLLMPFGFHRVTDPSPGPGRWRLLSSGYKGTGSSDRDQRPDSASSGRSAHLSSD